MRETKSRFVYVGPEGKLAGRLKRLASLRAHVARELKFLERFLSEHPELRLPAELALRRPRLVVNNTPAKPRSRQPRPQGDPEPPRAA
jgi:hypothetical protein